MFKIIALVACLAIVVFAEHYEDEEEHKLSAEHFEVEDEHKDYEANPEYKFEYGVKDPHTGDHKSQWEHRDGEIVVGSYSLDEADGTHRVVTYNSDDHNGFQAHVQRVGIAQHPHGESYSNIDQHH
ncbi:cuticle protein 19-like [Armigeres subalbatus]|uniref:cuticle protein 19-like n=1 Tax=Armigeres subalbatus TaxID=124917 RepID=UPI002ED13EC0